MRAFVTGGSGFVGSRLLPALRARGDEVRALARSEDSARRADPDRSMPLAAARALAAGGDLAWRLLPLPGQPPLSPTTLALVGVQVTVDDGRARRELGYAPPMSRERGLAELRG